MLNEENEFELDHGPLFSEEEQDEFLFRIFRHLTVGGSLCQFEVRTHGQCTGRGGRGTSRHGCGITHTTRTVGPIQLTKIAPLRDPQGGRR